MADNLTNKEHWDRLLFAVDSISEIVYDSNDEVRKAIDRQTEAIKENTKAINLIASILCKKMG